MSAFEFDDLMRRYVVLRARKKNSLLTAKHKDAICEIVRNNHLVPNQACRYVGVDHRTMKRATEGEEPKDPKWAEDLALSLSEAERYWMEWGRWCAEAKNSAGQKYAEFMLKSLNRERFGDKRSDGGAGSGVQVLIQTGGAPLQIREVTVETVEPTALVEGET